MVPKMYDALIKEGIEPKEAKDRIKKDLIGCGWSGNYILGLLPEESKDPKKVKAGSVQKTEQKPVILTDGSVEKGGESNSDDISTPDVRPTPHSLPSININQTDNLASPKQLAEAIKDAITEKMKQSHIQVLTLDEGCVCSKCRFHGTLRFNTNRRYVIS